jgi:hypothetical protein
MTLQEAAEKYYKERPYNACSKQATIKDFIAGAEYFKNVLIERFVALQDKAPNMKDMLYLDGVLVVIESEYTRRLSPESQPEPDSGSLPKE